MITNVDDYFAKGCGRCDRFETADCSTRKWLSGLQELRQICIETGLEEVAKWGHPTYMHAGRNIAVVGAHRGDFRLSFFNAGLMKDPDGVLQKQGPNTRFADCFKFSDNAEPAALSDTIKSYLTEAMGYAEQGLVEPKDTRMPDVPVELIEAMDTDPELAEAFHALTPGRQKSYAFAIGSAKQAQTRINRITKFRPKILAGKGANEY